MRFVPFEEAEREPNVVVDGAANAGTVLVLSHWPGAPTPPALRADTSAEIVLRHLAAPEIADLAESVEAVTNNHFDEDGLLGIWALLAPREEVWSLAERVVGASRAGDFGVVEDPEHAKVAFAIERLAADAMRRAEGDPTAAAYRELLPLAASILRSPERFERHWRERFDRFERDLDAIRDGGIALSERPEVDLAVVEDRADPAAVATSTDRMRVLHLPRDRRWRLQYRYETWVHVVSRPLPPRVDLAPLAEVLQGREEAPGRWVFDGVADLTPQMYLEGPDGEPAPSRIPADALEETVVAWLAEHQDQPQLQWRPHAA